MNLVDRVYSQAVASRLSGLSPDVLRDWRRRDFLAGVGEQTDAGRWVYSFSEIIELSIVRVLEGNGQPIRILLYMASRLSFYVLARFRPEETIFDHFRGKDARFPLDRNGHVSARVAPFAPPEMEGDLFAENAQAIEVNIPKLIEMLPAEVTNLLDEREDA